MAARPKDPWAFTASERRTIDAAYQEIARSAEHCGASALLKKACAYERKGSNITQAKAVLVASFDLGYRGEIAAGELLCISDGCRDAYLIGARWKRLCKPRLLAAASCVSDCVRLRNDRALARLYR